MTSQRERAFTVPLGFGIQAGIDLFLPPDMHVALNYGQGTGSVQMIRFLTEHTEVGFHIPNARQFVG